MLFKPTLGLRKKKSQRVKNNNSIINFFLFYSKDKPTHAPIVKNDDEVQFLNIISCCLDDVICLH